MISYKMYLPDTEEMPRAELHELVQKHAFRLGYYWLVKESSTCVQNSFGEFLYFYDHRVMKYGHGGYHYFLNSDATEITPEQFLALPVPEKKYRPFTNCELLRLIGSYTSSGFVKTFYKQQMKPAVVLLEKRESIGQKYTAIELLDECTFPDGTPCGVEVE